MKDTLILFGYGAAMVLGFAAVWTVVYYSFSRNSKYQTYTMKYKEDLSVENEFISNADEKFPEKVLDTTPDLG